MAAEALETPETNHRQESNNRPVGVHVYASDTFTVFNGELGAVYTYVNQITHS